LDRHIRLVIVLFVLLFLASTIVQDIRKPMWVDELYTLYTSRQATAAEIYKATMDGCDSMLLYDMIVHTILPVVRIDELAVRLPSTLGYCCMIVFLLAYCRRRLPTAYAMAAALLACNAQLDYSTEGRCYGVVLGCAAGALLCWQYAVEGRHRILAIPLLALSAALMTAMHYYSIFFWIPLLLAEMARWRSSRKLDWAILAAMTPVLFVLALHYQLILAGAQSHKHFYSPAEWSSIATCYIDCFEKMMLCCIFPATVLAVFSTIPDGRSAKQSSLIPSEWVALGAFSLMPLCVIVLAIYTTHMFVSRYVLWALPGVAILLVALLCRVARGRAVVGVSFLGLMVAYVAAAGVKHMLQKPELTKGEAILESLASLPNGTEPIVVADPHVFLELSYYADSRFQKRLVYPVSSALDLRYYGNDTNPIIFTALSHHTKLRIVPYDEVMAAHPRFVLAALDINYMPWHLIESGYRVVPIGSPKIPLLFEVEAPGAKN
jgi:hypothetical protein